MRVGLWVLQGAATKLSEKRKCTNLIFFLLQDLKKDCLTPSNEPLRPPLLVRVCLHSCHSLVCLCFTMCWVCCLASAGGGLTIYHMQLYEEERVGVASSVFSGSVCVSILLVAPPPSTVALICLCSRQCCLHSFSSD